MRRVPIISAGLTASVIALAAIPAKASTFVFSDTNYADADWTIINQFGLVSAGQVATGGHPGSYRQVALAVGQDVPFVGQISPKFAYSPAVQGAITGITYNIDLITTNAAGATYFPLLVQNGKTSVDAGDHQSGSATSNDWLNWNLVLKLSDFSELHISPSHGLSLDATSHPDFSATGAPITFGYEVTAGGGGFFTSVTGIDNDPITLTVTPTVTPPNGIPIPEPASGAILGAALFLMGLLRRRMSGGAEA